ncbi:MAG: hypothetical protein K2K47_04605, partial [Duncaniella sp.]|nr:hypothetical protein [Duncaniella sp.]
MDKTEKKKGMIERVLKIAGITIVALIVLFLILMLALFCLIGDSMSNSARKAYDETKTQLVDSLDNFIRINHRLPVLLSEIGLNQNPISYDIDGVFYVTLLPDDSDDNSYILKFGYRGDEAEYYFSKTGEWYRSKKTPTLFLDNDTMKRIDDIKLWLASDKFVHLVDSVRPNTSISFDYPVWCHDSIVFIHRYDEGTGMDMRGWAISDKYFILFNEFGDWEYCDEDGKIYHKFWNYRENDSLIYR